MKSLLKIIIWTFIIIGNMIQLENIRDIAPNAFTTIALTEFMLFAIIVLQHLDKAGNKDA
jgi:hypothetical protein